MFSGIQFNLKEIFFLFACSVVIGATIHFIFDSNYNEMYAAQSKKEILNSTELFDKVKVLCIILTCESNHKTRAIHVKNTWGSRCNKLIFASNVTSKKLGSLNLQKDDDYHILWGKTKHALSYVYENFYDDFDWFLKADDDTYAILDNMRYMLSAYSTNDPIYFGKKFKDTEELGYFSGGSGYVMSKTALKKFITEALPDETKCYPKDSGPEDWNLGICMENIGVYPGDARDQFKRETFFPFPPESHIFPSALHWYWTRLYYPNDEGFDCCSNLTISFHYIDPDMMYLMEYSIFNLQAYGVYHVYDALPGKKNFTAVVQTLLAELIRPESFESMSIDKQNF